MGKIYDASDVTQGEAVLADLARHPATAKFVAGKFARHFVADDPPPALVARLADVFARTGGDLKALAMALVDSEDAWKAPLAKCVRLINSWSRRAGCWRRSRTIPAVIWRSQHAGPAIMVARRAERFCR